MIETANITLATTVTMLTVSSTESCQNRFGSKVMPLSLAVAGVGILIWIKMLSTWAMMILGFVAWLDGVATSRSRLMAA